MFFSLIATALAAAVSAQPSVQTSTSAHAAIPAASTPAAHLGINVVYPPEGYLMAPAPGQWIIGSVSNPKALFRVNGSTVQTHKTTGGFLTYLPIYPGTMTLHFELELEGSATSFYRTFYVAVPPEPFTGDKPRIDSQMMSPSENLELRPGDWLTVQMKGTPGMNAQFHISGRKKFPMAPVNPSLGVYQGAYQIKPDDEFDNAEINFTLKGKGWSWDSATAKGKVTVKGDMPPVAAIRGNNASLKIAPNEGFVLFPLAGTKFLTAGSQGSETKLIISPTLSGWIATSSLQMMPAGTPPPRAVLGTIKTQANAGSTILSLGLTDNIPYSAEMSSDLSTLTIFLYSTISHTNWIIYDSADKFVRHIRWEQIESRTVEITVELNQRHLWGYRPYWENGSLKFELRHPPAFSEGSVFKNLNIVLDPGHMPSAPGAVGPTGLLEKDANLGIAKALDALLKKEGAHSLLTRAGDEEVSLTERPRFASEKHGDLFVSIHNNNLPDGANPFEYPHGFSTFYYQPISFKLAQAVHRAYQKGIHLPDEFLRYGNLLVARITEMPAILVESAYMTFPDQEAMLASPAFQKELASAMLEGMRRFLEAERAAERGSQKPAPAAPKAAPREAERILPAAPRAYSRTAPKAPVKAPAPAKKLKKGKSAGKSK